MRLWNALLNDESGFVLSAEAALVGTVGVLGATVGLSAASQALNDELAEMAFAIRSLDQSYSYQGAQHGSAWTAGSAYTQPPVEESLAQLRERMKQEQAQLERQLQQAQPAPAAAPAPEAVQPEVRQPERRQPERNSPERELDRRDRERSNPGT